MIVLPRPCVCLVTDRRALAPDARTTRGEVRALEEWLEDAVAARIDLIQIRERDLDAALLRALAARLVMRSTPATRVVVNDRADVAIAAGAAGVHLRADGPPPGRVRALHAGAWIVGRSVHSHTAAAAAGGADYVLFGTVFATGSKPGRPAAGIDALGDAIRSSPVPVLAVGGITPAGAAACAARGAAGVAAIGLFLPPGRLPHSLGPAAGARALRAAFVGDRC